MGEQPEQLRSDIERTRAELNQDMDRLAEKMSPTKTMERTVGRVSQGFAEKTSNVKNTVLGTAAEGSSSVADAATGVSDMARRRYRGKPVGRRPHRLRLRLAGRFTATGHRRRAEHGRGGQGQGSGSRRRRRDGQAHRGRAAGRPGRQV